MSLLITLASIAGYLALAGATARRVILIESQEERPWHMRHLSEETWRREQTIGAVILGVFWPLVWLVAGLRNFVAAPVSHWLWKPVTDRQERRERLEADRAAWLTKRRDAKTDDERRMASDVIESLEDILGRSR